VFQNGMGVADALETYTRLTIGDGLLTQVPAIVTSTAAGVLVTRAASRQELGQSLGKQLFFSQRVMSILCGAMVVMAFVPGFPMIPFLGLAALFGFIAYGLRQKRTIKLPAGKKMTQRRRQLLVVRMKRWSHCFRLTH
jgi:flagellar biosynthesis protein FlhA